MKKGISYIREVSGFDSEGGKLRVSETMIRKVVKEGRCVLTADAVQDREYDGSKSVLAYRLKSVMCVPLQIHDKILGCIYVDNQEKEGSFSKADLSFFTILSHQIAIAIENARLHRKIQTEKTSLEKRLREKEVCIVKSENMIELYQQVQKSRANERFGPHLRRDRHGQGPGRQRPAYAFRP